MARAKTFTDPIFSPEHPLVGLEKLRDRLNSLARPVAITGGTGFVGSHLVDTLCAAGIRPRVLVRRPERPRWIAGAEAHLIEGDLADRGALRSLVEGAGTVFHLAGVLRGATEEDFMEGNRDGTAAVVEAVGREAPGARLVHVSSQAAVGPSPTADGVSPSATPRPVSAYGRSKLAAEEEVRRGSVGAWSILRPPAIYGPRDTDVFEFFRLASFGIVALPSGERWITVAHVSDVVRAVVAAGVLDSRGRVYHVGGTAPLKMADMLRMIAEAGNYSARLLKLPPWLFRAAGMGASGLRRLGVRLPFSSDKAEEILARHWVLEARPSLEALGLEESESFADGVAAAWEWYRTAGWLR